MKTSNIIFIAFAIFIVGGMLFLFIDAKKHEKKDEEKKIEMKNNISYKEFPLQAFSVVVAEKGSDLHVEYSDTMSVKVEYLKDKKTPSKMYEVINDTLHIYGGLRTFVKCKEISAVVGNKPFWVGISNFTLDSLTIKMNGGRLIFNEKKMEIKELNQKALNLGIIANDNARLDIGNARLHNLSVKSYNAVVNNNCDVKHINLRLLHNADFYSQYGETLVVERDSTCNVRIDN